MEKVFAMCNVDENADLKMAEKIAFNAKVQRPGVCNAIETLLVHKNVAEQFLPPMAQAYEAAKVEIRWGRGHPKIHFHRLARDR